MFIQTEETPNPMTLKFLPGRTVLAEGTIEFSNNVSAMGTPLARALFTITGVARVFFGHDFISITKHDNFDWSLIKPMILECIVNYFTTHAKVEVNVSESNSDDVDDDEIVKEIKELLDSKIRPAVAMDGGDIVFDRFESGIVYLHMKGACSGCPSASVTLKSGIENMLRYYIPEVQEVQASESSI